MYVCMYVIPDEGYYIHVTENLKWFILAIANILFIVSDLPNHSMKKEPKKGWNSQRQLFHPYWNSSM